jgi:hypothetical protein
MSLSEIGAVRILCTVTQSASKFMSLKLGKSRIVAAVDPSFQSSLWPHCVVISWWPASSIDLEWILYLS